MLRAVSISHSPSAASHRPIVEAISTGDPDTVDAAVKQHIHEVPSLMAGRSTGRFETP